MEKIVYIIPGHGEQANSKRDNEVINIFKKKKFKIIPIKIKWKHKVMSYYISQFYKQLKYSKKDKVYLFGFSFGAMISFITSNEINPKAQLLCSLSPYFKKDLKDLTKSYKKHIGKKRLKDFEKFSFSDLAKKTKCKTILLVGTKENKDLKNGVKEANKKIKNSKLVLVKNAKHNISQKEYLSYLKKVILDL